MEQPDDRRIRPRLALAGKLLLLLAVVLALVLLGRNVPVERIVAWLSGEVEALGVWGPIAFAGLFVVLTVFLLPATPVTIACGAAFGPVLGAIVITIASAVSASWSFVFSRYIIHDRALGHIRRYPWLHRVYSALAGPDGWKVVAAVRLSHAMPFGVQNLVFGSSPIRFLPFLAATIIAMTPGTILYVYLGHLGAVAVQEGAGGEPSAGPLAWGFRIAGLVVAVLAVLYVTHLGRRIILAKAHVDLSKS